MLVQVLELPTDRERIAKRKGANICGTYLVPGLVFAASCTFHHTRPPSVLLS